MTLSAVILPVFGFSLGMFSIFISKRAESDSTVMTWMVIHRIEGDRLAEVWAATLPGVEWG